MRRLPLRCLTSEFVRDRIFITLHVQALLHGMMGFGIIGLVSKLHRWDDSAMFFDGSSLGEVD